MQPPISLHALIAGHEIEELYNKSRGILTVGSPRGPVQRIGNGDFEQRYTFGSIIKPLDKPARIGDETAVSIEIAAVRCFGTDDPSGHDEPYLITTVYAVSTKLGELNPQTTRFGPDEFGEVTGHLGENNIFAQGRQLAHDFPVPGDSDIRIHVQLWESEHGNPEDIKQKVSKAAGTAASTAVGELGPIGNTVAILAEVLGLLDTIGDAIGGVIGGIFGDDLIGVKDFVVPNDYLQKLVADPNSLTRRSDSIPSETFNFPQQPEDDSWLFSNGHASYRVFFRIKIV